MSIQLPHFLISGAVYLIFIYFVSEIDASLYTFASSIIIILTNLIIFILYIYSSKLYYSNDEKKVKLNNYVFNLILNSFLSYTVIHLFFFNILDLKI